MFFSTLCSALQDGYERSPPATPMAVGLGAGPAADPTLLTPGSFSRSHSDVFHTPAGSRSHSMEFPRIEEDAVAPIPGSDGGGGNGGREGGEVLPTYGASRLSQQSYAVTAAGAVNAAGAAKQDRADGGGAATAPESGRDGSSRPAPPPTQQAEDAAAGDSGSTTTQQGAVSAGSHPGPAPAQPASPQRGAEEVGGSTDSQPPASLSGPQLAASAQATEADAAGAVAAEQPAAAAGAGAAARTPAESSSGSGGGSGGTDAGGSGTAAHPNTNAQGDLLHPWSLANPGPLAAPQPEDAGPATISLADASSPVGGC